MNTHALSAFAIDALRKIKETPTPSQEFNPGVTGKLVREGLAELILLPTPYKTRSGKIEHLKITSHGIAVLSCILNNL